MQNQHAEMPRQSMVKGSVAQLAWLAAIAVSGGVFETVATASVRETFDEPELSSRVDVSASTARVDVHRREATGGFDEAGCERVVVKTSRLGTVATWQQDIVPARVIDELQVALVTRCSVTGLQLAARVVFPHQVDPRNGRTLTDVIRGPAGTRPGRWQQLVLERFPARLRERLVLLRARLKLPTLDSRDAYIDRVILRIEPPPGRTGWLIDDLRVRPVVAPRSNLLASVAAREPEDRETSPVTMRLDRMIVEDYPFFPRIIPYHGESPEVLKAAGANLVLISDHRQLGLVQRLRDAGVWVMAEPPRPTTADGALADARTATLVPIDERSDGVLCWYLGSKIPSRSSRVEFTAGDQSDWTDLTRWVGQVRSADRRRQRPILADVVGFEHVVSRQRLLPSVSRDVIQTGFPLRLYQRWLEDRRRRMRPGALAWTWIRTDTEPLLIEPEQIELQVRAALASGYRGIGFAKSRSLETRGPGARERQLMLGLINLELELLEPWLATSTRIGQLPITVGRVLPAGSLADQPEKATSRSLDTGRRARRRRRVVVANNSPGWSRPRIDRRVQAVLFRTEYGRLLMTSWIEENAQFVPGQMALTDVSVVVPGGDETSTAWEVTTTGLHSVPMRRVAGGVELRLKWLDRAASIILTSDHQLVGMLRKKVTSLAPRAARMALELAQAKLGRVRQVDRRLRQLGQPQPDADRLLSRAFDCLTQAAAAIDRNDLDGSRRWSDSTLQTVRILQRAHWEHTVGKATSPVASTWSRCFQTLPQHWIMQQTLLANQAGAEPRLVGGDFEDIQEMIRAGWTSRHAEVSGMTMKAEVYDGGTNGGTSGSCLRLVARPGPRVAVPSTLPWRTVTVQSPRVPVEAGELIRISGRVRLVSSGPGGLDGGVIEDSLGGSAAGLHCRRPGGWRRFELVRRAPRATDVRLQVAMEGVGELRVDDLQIEVIPGGLAPSGRLPKVEPDTVSTRAAR